MKCKWWLWWWCCCVAYWRDVLPVIHPLWIYTYMYMFYCDIYFGAYRQFLYQNIANIERKCRNEHSGYKDTEWAPNPYLGMISQSQWISGLARAEPNDSTDRQTRFQSILKWVRHFNLKKKNWCTRTMHQQDALTTPILDVLTRFVTGLFTRAFHLIHTTHTTHTENQLYGNVVRHVWYNVYTCTS